MHDNKDSVNDNFLATFMMQMWWWPTSGKKFYSEYANVMLMTTVMIMQRTLQIFIYQHIYDTNITSLWQKGKKKKIVVYHNDNINAYNTSDYWKNYVNTDSVNTFMMEIMLW